MTVDIYSMPFENRMIRGRYLSINAVTAIAYLGLDSFKARKEMRRAKFYARAKGFKLLPGDIWQKVIKKKLNSAWSRNQ